MRAAIREREYAKPKPNAKRSPGTGNAPGLRYFAKRLVPLKPSENEPVVKKMAERSSISPPLSRWMLCRAPSSVPSNLAILSVETAKMMCRELTV